MQFISDQEGIMNRYLREKDNWDSHLDNTKDFINASFKGREISTVAVLGSGWLLDLPLKKLSERFKKVLLVDVHHPPQVHKKVEKYDNVILFETDLTGGGIEFCWELRIKKGDHFKTHVLDDFEPKRPDLPIKVDAYISLNLLNQLDILLVDFLKRKNGRFLEDEYDRFRKNLQDFHLEWITKKPACLISDVLEINVCDEGIEEKQLIYTEFPEAKRNGEWTWDFDLSGQYQEDCKTSMFVRAFEW